MLLSPQLLHDIKSIFYHQVQFFIFLPSKVSDSKTRGWGDAPLLTFSPGEGTKPNFSLHKVNFCHQV